MHKTINKPRSVFLFKFTDRLMRIEILRIRRAKKLSNVFFLYSSKVFLCAKVIIYPKTVAAKCSKYSRITDKQIECIPHSRYGARTPRIYCTRASREDVFGMWFGTRTAVSFSGKCVYEWYQRWWASMKSARLHLETAFSLVLIVRKKVVRGRACVYTKCISSWPREIRIWNLKTNYVCLCFCAPTTQKVPWWLICYLREWGELYVHLFQ